MSYHICKVHQFIFWFHEFGNKSKYKLGSISWYRPHKSHKIKKIVNQIRNPSSSHKNKQLLSHACTRHWIFFELVLHEWYIATQLLTYVINLICILLVHKYICWSPFPFAITCFASPPHTCVITVTCSLDY